MNGISLPAPNDTGAAAAPGWLPMLHTAMLQLAAALSPSIYTPDVRHVVASGICSATAQAAPRFLALAGLLSLVIVHIVVVTAQSYGLSQFALSTVIRVLVVELLPLAAALFVSLRLSPDAASPTVGPHADSLAGVVSRFVLVILLTTASGVIALILAYLSVYGFTPWGLSAFTRTIGQVFDPLVLMALALKTLLFAASVATLAGTARLFGLLIAVETLMLVAEFF
ncbi:ABC transporter permease [Accumulibacter sp.]|jgi:phospholipid/cholesterol/gamma-HCH transport system permease protein|uniref:ABC transporter permease n=1 Tax=Accumulibacter sp. TaxID=2053492 RepID=UPI001AC7CB63|nr:ABC transporter permease [Accumulibacter sp.]MBN8454956.1 ABC transporter permease [Accumulibacter sp.]MBO3705165.1 ABC transporter permease [Candidatus Accumulibacter conexus]